MKNKFFKLFILLIVILNLVISRPAFATELIYDETQKGNREQPPERNFREGNREGGNRGEQQPKREEQPRRNEDSSRPKENGKPPYIIVRPDKDKKDKKDKQD
ncbi:MAG: hypothetical protein AB1489_07205 [Acidobacteriota bacterium]